MSCHWKVGKPPMVFSNSQSFLLMICGTDILYFHRPPTILILFAVFNSSHALLFALNVSIALCQVLEAQVFFRVFEWQWFDPCISRSRNSQRVASFRQLSNSFSQFSNLQTPPRSKKPLTRKDAQLINEWRFMKLKEFRDKNIEAENEAFDRYMRNVSLLEEAFSVNALVNNENDDESSAMNSVRSADDSTDVMVTWLKANIRSDPVRKENIRKRMQYVVDQGLKACGKFESRSSNGNAGYPDETRDKPKRMKSEESESSSMLDELIDKVSKARNEEDLKACHDLKSQLLNPSETTASLESDIVNAYEEHAIRNNASPLPVSSYTPTKSFSTTTIDQESLCRIDEWFSTLQDVEEL